jgi:predicted transcriptional regulator of viral defense system
MSTELRAQLEKLFAEVNLIRPRDLTPAGIPRWALSELVADGTLYRSGRGLYGLTARSVSEHHSLAQAAKRVPAGVICLLSALVFHRLTTQTPHQVWLALAPKARKPAVDYPPLRLVRFSGRALTDGVEQQTIEGVPVQVTSVAKTVADCFKYRHKIGTAIAVEALLDARKQGKLDLDELWRMATVCRVPRIILPYLETIQ